MRPERTSIVQDADRGGIAESFLAVTALLPCSIELMIGNISARTKQQHYPERTGIHRRLERYCRQTRAL
jgi:hypothetical protein